jgi:hypothetical protein
MSRRVMPATGFVPRTGDQLPSDRRFHMAAGSKLPHVSLDEYLGDGAEGFLICFGLSGDRCFPLNLRVNAPCNVVKHGYINDF